MALALAALVLLAPSSGAAGGGGCHKDGISDGPSTQVNLTQACFELTVVRVQPGEQVTFTNRDAVAHTVTGVRGSWGTYDELREQDSVSYAFQQPGVFPYFCLLHPTMVGAVVVGDGRASASLNAGAGVSAVSAVAPGGVVDARAPQQGQGGADGIDTPLVALIAVVAAAAGLTAGLFTARGRSRSS